jgi:hypothetical protein
MTLWLHDPATETVEHYEFADHAERRRGLRVRQARPVKIYEATGARFFGGITSDISSTGLRIEIPASAVLQPGRILNVHVGLSRDGSMLANRRQIMPARVVWVDGNAAAAVGHVVAGVEFLASIAAHLDAA